MARPLRLKYARGSHLMALNQERGAISLEDDDRERFLAGLGGVSGSSDRC